MTEKNDKTVIVTGGASGIGFETSKALVESGYNVVVVDNDSETYEHSLNALPNTRNKFSFLKLNLSDWGSGKSIMDFCKEINVHPFALINNIGVRSNRDLLTEDFESWETTFSLSLRTAFAVSQSFITQNSYNGKRYIVNIGSITASFVSNQSPAYHVSKAGLEGLTRYLAVAAPAHGHGINVNCLSLGFIVQKRHLNKYLDVDNAVYRDTVQKHLPNGEVGHESDVANAIHFLISGKADFINGAIIPLDGGATLVEHFTSAWLNK